MGRKSKADQRRTEIIQAFYHCVKDQGAANASIRKIADRAGVQPSTLHHYFKNREEIIEEAVKDFTDRIFNNFREQMASLETGGADLSDAQAVDQGMGFIFSSGMINEDHTGFFLECCVAARHNPRIRATIADLFVRFRGAIVEHLGRVPGFAGLDPSQKALLASLIVAIHEGIELQWFADPQRMDQDGMLDKALHTTMDIISFFMENAGQSSKGG